MMNATLRCRLRGVGWEFAVLQTRLMSTRVRQPSAIGDDDVFGGAAASPECRETFAAWHRAVDTMLQGSPKPGEAVQLLRPHMDEKCIFRPPTYYKPWVGRDETLLLLGAVSEVFGSSFKYGRQWLSEDGREWALEFSAEIGVSGRRVDGIDLISLCDEGKIRDFTVLARPPNAVAELKKEMMSKVPVRLAALKAKQMMGLA
jgi:hypothetical protein